MKYSRLTIAVALLLLSWTLHSQSLINSTGSTITTPDYIVEFSVGEIGITTLSDATGANFITQGLLQPILKITDPDCPIINDSLIFFPNPTRNFLSVVPKYNWITSYRIYAIDGKLVRVASFISNQINLIDLAPGVYFIQFLPGCNNKYRTIKVIKQ
jgi:hypothetical protein